MAENSHRVRIGARGCWHPGWAGTFYPDDLPQDWRLAYYVNEFNFLVVGEQDWMLLENITAFVDEMAADFSFVVELPVSVNEAQLALHIERFRQAGKHCVGVIIEAGQMDLCDAFTETVPCYIKGQSNLLKIQAGTSLKELRTLMDAAMKAQSAYPVLFVVEGAPPDIELLRHAKIMIELME